MSKIQQCFSAHRYRLGLLAMTAVLCGALSGCATSGHSQGVNVGTMRGGAPTGEEISRFLDNATPGSIATFQKSPWGSNVSVIVQERYFSASGMICTHLDVARDGAVSTDTSAMQTGAARQGGAVPGSTAQYGQRAQVACLVEGKGWYTQRLVTQILAAPDTTM